MDFSRGAVLDFKSVQPSFTHHRLRRHLARVAVAATSAALAAVTLASPALAAGTSRPSQPTGYKFSTVEDGNDVTFNQLLGINNFGQIAGYFGSGGQGHPNKGYLTSIEQPTTFANENFPGSVQTQVTGLNDRGVTVGFWSSMNDASLVNENSGFYESQGSFHTVNFPTGAPATPPVDQLLGINDWNVAVGFYTDSAGVNHGYTYNIGTNHYTPLSVPNSAGVTAAAINNLFDIAGFYTNATTGDTDGFLLTPGGHVTDISVPGASSTMALGVNDHREVVGLYTIGSGSTAVTHGFTWTPHVGFQTVDDPYGIGTTTINGVNDSGDLVGFYIDPQGNTDGLLARPIPAS